MISLWIGLSRQPPRISSPASQSSSSGCVGRSPCVPKSLGVATIPRPKWCCQSRLTITRASRWPAPWSTSVSQSARAVRRYDVRQPFGRRRPASARPLRGPGVRTCRKPCVASPCFWFGSPRLRKYVFSKKSAPCVWSRIAGRPSLVTITFVIEGFGLVPPALADRHAELRPSRVGDPVGRPERIQERLGPAPGADRVAHQPSRPRDRLPRAERSGQSPGSSFASYSARASTSGACRRSNSSFARRVCSGLKSMSISLRTVVVNVESIR